MQNENIDHLLSSYIFDLPDEFIATRPVEGRHNSRLMVYHAQTGKVEHRHFYQLPELLSAGDHLVMNNSKVFPCRLFGQRPSGGNCELFILSLLHQDGLYPAMIKANGKRKVGELFHFGELTAKLEKLDDGILVSFSVDHQQLLQLLEQQGNVPIPPYIRRGISDERDQKDYQTVYAQHTGSVAAPTAGLHFTPELLQQLNEGGIEQSYVTLHVGAGTFRPVNSENILEHTMHSEYFAIENQQLHRINSHIGNLIAVGTTTLRVLESCYRDQKIELPEVGMNSTDIFLYPGKSVNSIKGLITNFHLPGSSLIMLVSSLIGRDKTLELYQIAKDMNYRFFSYGDAMLILR